MNQSLPVISLGGSRPDSLLGYLKGIGLLRLVATQFAPDVSAGWPNRTLELRGLNRESLESFLLERYEPTPIMNPWNSGAGFDDKSEKVEAGKAIARVAATRTPRWAPYRDTIDAAKRVVLQLKSDAGDRGTREVQRKQLILLRLRECYSDRALEWLDAAVSLGRDRPRFPPLLGSGGNDGHLDFSVNFMQRALDVIGPSPRHESAGWLRDSLSGEDSAPLLADVAIGQFSLAAAGGPNATAGFSADSLVNPWDFILMIEGAIAFAGTVVKRFSAEQSASAPFTFAAVGAGYGSASEEEDVRGEIWLPQWRGHASYASIRSLLRSGRAELNTESSGATAESRIFTSVGASDALAAVQAAQTLGVATGVARFSRIVIAKRNGLAFGATYAGEIEVASRPAIAALSRATLRWVNAIRRIERKELGTAARAALRKYDESLVAYAGIAHNHAQAKRMLQNAVCAIAELDAAMAFSRSNVDALGFLEPDIIEFLDDGTLENEVALAVCSIGATNRLEQRIRLEIAPIVWDERKRRLTYDASVKPVWHHDIRKTMSAILARRVRLAAQHPLDPVIGFRARLGGTYRLGSAHFGGMLLGAIDWRRVKDLVRAYSIVEPARLKIHYRESPDDARVPAAFAALKILLGGVHNLEAAASARSAFVDLDCIIQLQNNFVERALTVAYGRLRATGLVPRDFRTTSVETKDLPTFCAALLPPMTGRTEQRFLSITLQPTDRRNRQ